MASSVEKPQPTMASGAPVMTKLISAYEPTAQPSPTIKRGWLTISGSGRAGAPKASAADEPPCPARRNARTIAPMAASTTIEAKAPANITGWKRLRGVDHDLRPDNGGHDAASQHEGDGTRLELRRRVVCRGKAELLHESAADAQDRKLSANSQNAALEQEPVSQRSRRAR